MEFFPRYLFILFSSTLFFEGGDSGTVQTSAYVTATVGSSVDLTCTYTVDSGESVYSGFIAWKAKTSGTPEYENIATFSPPGLGSNSFTTTESAMNLKDRAELLDVTSSGSNTYRAVMRVKEVQYLDEKEYQCSVTFINTITGPQTKTAVTSLTVQVVRSQYLLTAANNPQSMDFFFPLSPAWMHPVRPRFPLQPCGRCGLRHGWNICSAISSQCFKCGRKGHYARMCRTRNSGAATNVVSSVTSRTFGTQTEEVGKRKSVRKQTRDRDRIKKFNKDRREKNNLREMPFATINVNEIQSEMIETEIEKYRQQASSKKAEADFLKRDRKTLERQILEKDNTIKRQSEELSAQLDDLAESRIKQAELQVALQALQDKLESMQSKENQKASFERPRASHRAQSGPKRHPGQHFQTRNPRHAFPIAHSCTGSATGSAKNYRKHEDVFRGARGYCHRVRNTYLE